MTSTDSRNPAAVREYEAATASLADAHELIRAMDDARQLHPFNGYLADARDRAYGLVREMEDNLNDVIDRWSPAECGLED